MPRGRIANTLDDFWSYVDVLGKDDCWIFNGTIHWSGYGNFCINKTLYQAHRVSYFLSNPGQIELAASSNKKERTFVLHSCDVRRCCNPKHLWLGSYDDNMKDMVKKGRQRGVPGELNPAAKLKDFDIPKIRELLNTKKHTQWEIARMYDVRQSVISLIKLGKSHRHVT